jgi:isoleucyl-tRNA synthetase
VDWKSSLNLPKTEFPMRADLARREPQWLDRWEKERSYEKLLEARAAAGAPRFVLHDGPPYANGSVHYGHVLNKVLKDMVVRSRLLMGYHADFVPGWDCHGLPIEHQVERALGDREKVGLQEFRRQCEAYALKYVDAMRVDFKRLGCVGRWSAPYLTLSHDYEATIVRVLGVFQRQGLLYRAKRPVHWCMTHRTALAEAEVEYADHSSPSIYVRFPLLPDQGPVRAVFGDNPAALVIWTTTPWTIPANLAVVANPELTYVGLPTDKEVLIVAKGRAEAFLAACGLDVPAERWIEISPEELRTLHGVRYRHPFVPEPRSDRDYRLLFAEHATLEAGTGLVHTAPGHGAEDYVVGRDAGLDIYAPVDEAGRYTSDVPRWVGLSVLDANPKVVAALAESGALLNRPGESLKHSYPHCWRCKNPVIFRATSQWFARLGESDDSQSLRRRALEEIDRTQWIPAWGRERIHGMIAARPDWCLSRQRVWGVPIPALRCTGCQEAVLLPEVIERVAELFAREGSNAWFDRPVAELAPGAKCDKCGGTALEKGNDIVDVWFESGVSWAAVADGKLVPAGHKVDLYVEGADQHRGWFHSSLLTSVAVQDKAPYQNVLTHGWVLDEKGRAYSKSDIEKARAAGIKIDYVDPSVFIEKNGAEILRLWVASGDTQADVVYSQTIINQLSESLRKIRNTCRYLLSNLYDFAPDRDWLDDQDLREVDLLAVGVLRERDHDVFGAYRRYSFHEVVRLTVDYLVTASAEYLDPVKDVLYCEGAASPARRSVQTAFYEMVRTVAAWIAPIMCFSAQDVADELGRLTGQPFDVHGHIRPEAVPTGKELKSPNKRWTDEIRPRREAILAQLEPFRKAGHKSLHARVVVRPAAAERPHWQWNLAHLQELTVVSQLELTPDDAAGPTEITVSEASLPECPRCWRRTGAASGHPQEPTLCNRCAAVVDALTTK